jgi:hypothetical protein
MAPGPGLTLRHYWTWIRSEAACEQSPGVLGRPPPEAEIVPALEVPLERVARPSRETSRTASYMAATDAGDTSTCRLCAGAKM